MDTFEGVWRRLLLRAPEVPVFLARDFVQTAYARLSEDRPWSWLRVETLVTTLASRSLTVGVTQGSTTVTSAAAFVATDLGRQFRVASQPIYAIATFTDASTIVLDRAYVGPTDAAASATILDAYYLAPADFNHFLTIADPSTGRTIPFWFSEEQLNAQDPYRTATGDPARALVAKRNSALAASLGRALYEWWPYPTAARTYPALYVKRPTPLADLDSFQGVLADRGDLLLTGALSEVAQWPGTADRPNPYFNLANARAYREEFQRERTKLGCRDDDTYPQDWDVMGWQNRGAWGMIADTRTLRATDATLADYY